MSQDQQSINKGSLSVTCRYKLLCGNYGQHITDTVQEDGVFVHNHVSLRLQYHPRRNSKMDSPEAAYRVVGAFVKAKRYGFGRVHGASIDFVLA